MHKILVIGSTNIDLIARVSHLPRPGETVGEACFMQSNGGKGANQAVAAARLGGDVAFVSCLGNDAGAAALRSQFQDDGIDTSALLTAEGTPTGTALIFVSHDGENCIAVAPGANRGLTPAAVDGAAERIAAADYLLLQLEIPAETVVRAVETAHAAGTRVVLNPAPAMPLAAALGIGSCAVSGFFSRLFPFAGRLGMGAANLGSHFLLGRGGAGLHLEGGDGIAHPEGPLVTEQLGCEGQSLQRTGHDLEGAQPALRRALAHHRIQGEELLQGPAGEHVLHGSVELGAGRVEAVGTVFPQAVGQIPAGDEHAAHVQTLGRPGDGLPQEVVVRR